MRNNISGKCGKNAAYVLETNGILRIFGAGEVECIVFIDNGGEVDEKSIWKDKEIDVVEVVIEEGITSLSMFAFLGLDKLERVTLPDTLKEIGDFCFADCSKLRSMNRPKGLEIVGFESFKGCMFDKSEFPKERLRLFALSSKANNCMKEKMAEEDNNT